MRIRAFFLTALFGLAAASAAAAQCPPGVNFGCDTSTFGRAYGNVSSFRPAPTRQLPLYNEAQRRARYGGSYGGEYYGSYRRTYTNEDVTVAKGTTVYVRDRRGGWVIQPIDAPMPPGPEPFSGARWTCSETTTEWRCGWRAVERDRSLVNGLAVVAGVIGTVVLVDKLTD